MTEEQNFMRRIGNIRLPNPLGISNDSYWSILLDKKNIVRSLDVMPSEIKVPYENWQGDWLSPMGIDLQFNGGFGLAFNDLDLSNVPMVFDLLDQLWLDGIEAICPTIVTCSIKALRQSLDVLHQVRLKSSERSCKLLGAHLEGPFLSRSYFGAHQIQFLANPSVVALEDCIKGYEAEIALMTLAPELPGSLDVIQRLRQLGVIISLGHSAATATDARVAFENGVSMITHAFNAMPLIHHRSPGPLVEAISNGEIFIGLIADGVHVHPQIVKILQQLSSAKLVLVSDALSPYGMPQEKFKWDERILTVKNGVCSLENGTLVGTTLPLLSSCIRMAKWTKEISSSIWSSTVAPRMALQKGYALHDYILGKSFNQLLRWKWDEQSKELTWNYAS